MKKLSILFQYRKRYEITCDGDPVHLDRICDHAFQYRKRYEITCDTRKFSHYAVADWFQYRKRYEITCDDLRYPLTGLNILVSIPQAV